MGERKETETKKAKEDEQKLKAEKQMLADEIRRIEQQTDQNKGGAERKTAKMSTVGATSKSAEDGSEVSSESEEARRAKEEAERQAKEEAERKAKEEAARQIKETEKMRAELEA